MKILVLGGSGFIGMHIVDGLLAEGHKLTVFDRASIIYKGAVEYIHADIGDVMALSEALIGVDIVVHLISTSVPSTSNKDPISDVNGNLINTLKLLDVMHQTDVKKIIYFSSGGTVYGLPNQVPMTEEHTTNPICSYGVVKLAIEKYLHMYAELYGFTSTILRPSNPYGPGQKHMGVQGFIGTCINNALNNTKLTIWGDGSVIRDYIYISDVVNATKLAVQNMQSGAFNISSGEGYSLNEIISYVEESTQKTIQTEYKSKRNFDIPTMVLDNQKAGTTFEWKPAVDIKKGIDITVQAMIKATRV